MSLVDQIKQYGNGRWLEVLSRFGIAADLLDGKGHPCPKCGGDDRFSVFKDFAQTGGVICSKCFRDGGDGIASVAWIQGTSNGEAIKQLGDHFGIVDSVKPAAEIDIVASVCADKRMPVEAFKSIGAQPVKIGRSSRSAVKLPVYDERGEQCGSFDMWPGDKGRFARGSNHGLFLLHQDGKPRLPRVGEAWVLVEGCKDQAALVGLGFNAIGLPTSFLDSKFADLLRGVNVTIVPDLDEPGQNGAQKTGGNLRGIAATVRIARLPGEIRTSKGDDVRDVLHRSNIDGKAVVKAAIENAEDWQPREGEHDPRDGRPEIFVTLIEGAVADQVVRALGKLGWVSPWIPSQLRPHTRLYNRGGALVAAVESEDPEMPKGSLAIRPVPLPIIRERITQACKLVQEKETDGEIEIVAVTPPRWLQDAIHQRGWYGGVIRPLTGIIQAPTLRSDGSILQTPGWDASTGLIYSPLIEFPKIPNNPSLADAQKAAQLLLEVVADFPFEDDSDKVAWLCIVLTMIGRQCVDGCVPMFVLTANTRGAGKSLGVDAASIIAYGRPAARRVFTRDDDEQRKSITTTAMEGTPSVLLDNVDQQLGGGPLDAALTSRTWSDRVLGSSRTTGELPLKTVWTATGNNIAYGSDLARRVLPIRLQSPLETPEDRTDFQHADLLGWVSFNRPQLAAAALTILRAYFSAGRPTQAGGQWGSFEQWSANIRGAVVWAGFADPLQTRQSATSSDDSRELLGLLITGLQEADPEGRGLTAKEIENVTSYRSDHPPTCPTLVEAVGMICGGKFDTRRFSRRLRGYYGRNWKGLKLESDSAHGGIRRYLVKIAKPSASSFGGCGGSGGSQYPNPDARDLVCGAPYIQGDTHSSSESARGNSQPPEPPEQPSPKYGSEVVL